jgi:large subunit ribosomal protein L2
MSIKTIKPHSHGNRSIIVIDYKKHLSGHKRTKHLTHSLQNRSGRNNQGKTTVFHRGGKNKRAFREIDFKRNEFKNVPAVVKTIEYDPNRTCFISLLVYENGKKTYILTPKDIKIGDKVMTNDTTDIKIGNCMKVGNMPEGTFVHNVELTSGHGGQLGRSAGTMIQVLGKDETGRYTVLKLSSGETRKVFNDCFATIGIVSNEDHNLVNLGKAGKSRYIGVKPTVRGSAMNPVDHPHGGGEGRQGVGRPAPLSP